MDGRTMGDLITFFAGIWLIVSVFFFGGIGTVILVNNVIVGVILILVALRGILEENSEKL